MDELFEEHLKVFGVKPVITGINFHNQDDIVDGIEEAIKTGIPYVEEDVEDGLIV
jgi:hypothetical protein